MRQLASFLLLGLALDAGAADVWRWVDANGVVHLSDQPTPGAERVVIATSPPASTPQAPRATPAPQPSVPTSLPADIAGYARCVITAPANDTVFNINDAVQAGMDLAPALEAGHRIQVFLNGQPYADWPPVALSHTFANLFRGSYSLTMRVLGADGRTLCTSAPVSFHIRQPSLLSPLRRPQGG